MTTVEALPADLSSSIPSGLTRWATLIRSGQAEKPHLLAAIGA